MIHVPMGSFFKGRAYPYFLVFQGVRGGRPTVFSTWAQQPEPITAPRHIQGLIVAQAQVTPDYDHLTLLHWVLMDGQPHPHQVADLERLVQRMENLPRVPLGAELLRNASGAVDGWVAPRCTLGRQDQDLAPVEYRPARGVVCTGAGNGIRCGWCLACKVDQLRAEAAALRDDAARYRYLRDDLGLRFKLPGQPLPKTAADNDAAIDAARAVH